MPDEMFETGDGIEQAACHHCGNVVDVTCAEPFSVVACPSCGAKLTVPAKLGEFLLLKALGKGTMGTAYKAFDRSLGRHVAIKVMHRSLGEDQELVERFLGEARALASLNHRNVVQIYSLGKNKGRPYLVMELAAGGSLRARLRKDRLPGEAEVLDIAVQVVEGLKAAHGIGLIHGDVKPANILFGEDGSAKLVDFGLARFGGVKQQPGEGLGTPYYVAPERVRKEDADHRADIYSLGATLYHVLAGEPPFEADTVKGVLLARLRTAPPSLRSYRSDISPQTCAIIARMLAPDPDDRHQKYDELLGELKQAYSAAQRTPERAGTNLDHLQRTLASTLPARQAAAEWTPPPGVTPAEVIRPAVAAPVRAAAVLSRPQTRELNVVVLCLVAGALLLVAAGIVFGVWFLAGGDEGPVIVPDEGGGSTSTGEPGGQREPFPPRPVEPPQRLRPDVRHPKPPRPPVEPAVPASTIRLKAMDADIQGSGAVYESDADKQCIGEWRGKDVTAGWEFELNSPGEYFLDVIYACERSNAGGTFTVRIAAKEWQRTVESTGGWSEFQTRRLGRARLADPGMWTVQVTGRPKRNKALMNLREVRLVPAGT